MSLFLFSILLYPSALPGEPEAGQKPNRYPCADLLVEAAELAKPEVVRQFRILDGAASTSISPVTFPARCGSIK